MSLEAGEFTIQSGTGGGREAELPPTNLEGLPRTFAPSLDLSSPSPACLSSTKFLPLPPSPGITSFSFSLPRLSPRSALLRIQNSTCTLRREDNGALKHALVPLSSFGFDVTARCNARKRSSYVSRVVRNIFYIALDIVDCQIRSDRHGNV